MMYGMAKGVSQLLGILSLVGGAAYAALPGASGHLPTNEQHERLFTLAQGDVVLGNWEQDEAVGLSLYGPQGKRLRELALPSEKKGEFSFVATEAGEYRIRLSGSGNYHWAIDRLIPESEQQAKPDTPLQSDLIRQWERRLQTGENTQAFWQHVEKVGAPLVERLSNTHDRVTFVWRGARQGVRLLGGPAIFDGGQLHQLADSDIWYASYDISRDAVFSYQFVPDLPVGVPDRLAMKAVLQADPYNPHVFYPNVRDLYRNRSVLTLANTPATVIKEDGSHVVAQGNLESFDFTSVILGNTRKVRIYTPPVPEGQTISDVMVLLDGDDYLNIVQVPAMIDQLIQEQKIAPLKVVLVSNASAASRREELPPFKEDFVDFLDQELLPWMNEHGVQAPADRSIIAGSSYGGLAALHAGLQLPHHFGKVLSLSGSFWWAPEQGETEWLAQQFIARDPLNLDVYMSAGLYEQKPGKGLSLLQSNRHMRDILLAKGYRVKYQEVSASHDFLNWRRTLPQGLQYFLGQTEDESDH